MIEVQFPGAPRRVVTVLIALAALAGLAASAAADLTSDVQRAYRTVDLKKARLAVSIRECDTDQQILTIDAERPMIPASNLKLLTTGAFLYAFGPDFQFRTRMVRVGEDLVIQGDGDPAFADPALLAEMTYVAPDGKERRGLDVESLLGIWTDAVKSAGIGVIDEVIIDARIFDDLAYHPNWPKDQYKEDYCAEVWGLNFHHNLLQVWPRPRPGSTADDSRMAPQAPWLKSQNSTSSRTGPQDRHTFWMNRPPDQNSITLNGNVKFPATDPASVTLHDVPNFFARLFAERLRSAGIKVRAYRAATRQDPPFEGDAVGPEIRTPMATALRRCNTDSDNLYAECLIKRLGYAATRTPGSWQNGTAAMRHALAEQLHNPALASTVNPDDGSGLSRENKITAAAMTAWLNTFVRNKTLGPLFLESMAIGGKTGTVKKRFKDVEKTGCVVQCKTGYIRGVSCLSGIVTAPDGRRLTFSILCNDLVESDAVAKAKSFQEKVVTAIAESLHSGGMPVKPKVEALGGG